MTERGSASLELALGVAVLMFPVVVGVLSFGPWLERLAFVRQSAAEVSRAVAVAVGETDTALAHVVMAADGSGYPLDEVRVGLCGATPAPVASGGASACPDVLQRGEVVRARVEADVPLVVLPWRGEGGNVSVGGISVSADHQTMVDLYRSLGDGDGG